MNSRLPSISHQFAHSTSKSVCLDYFEPKAKKGSVISGKNYQIQKQEEANISRVNQLVEKFKTLQ
jgi:hypothetical protein